MCPQRIFIPTVSPVYRRRNRFLRHHIAQFALLLQTLAPSHSKRKYATPKPPTFYKSIPSPKHHVPAKNIYSNFISTLSPPQSVPLASHRPIRAIATNFGPVSLEKEVSHAETLDLLQIHTKSQTPCGRKEYLFQFYLHFIAAAIGSSGITSPNSRYCYKVWPRLTRKGSKPRRNPGPFTNPYQVPNIMCPQRIFIPILSAFYHRRNRFLRHHNAKFALLRMDL